MPLFLCPNCNVSMQAVQRRSIELDICPQCRGVWLDRGELEKLIAEEPAGSGEGRDRRDERPEPARPAWGLGHDDHDRHRRDHDDHDHHQGRHRKRSSIFDIFD
jgi:Zn-finger nucleic acid-binding protein